jgi:hypothetical protein
MYRGNILSLVVDRSATPPSRNWGGVVRDTS